MSSEVVLNFSMHQNHRASMCVGGLSTQILQGPNLKCSDSVGLRWGLKIVLQVPRNCDHTENLGEK